MTNYNLIMMYINICRYPLLFELWFIFLEFKGYVDNYTSVGQRIARPNRNLFEHRQLLLFQVGEVCLTHFSRLRSNRHLKEGFAEDVKPILFTENSRIGY